MIGCLAESLFCTFQVPVLPLPPTPQGLTTKNMYINCLISPGEQSYLHLRSHALQGNVSLNVACGQGALAPPRKVVINVSHPRSTDQKLWKQSLAICALTSSPHDSDACSNMRTTTVQVLDFMCYTSSYIALCPHQLCLQKLGYQLVVKLHRDIPNWVPGEKGRELIFLSSVLNTVLYMLYIHRKLCSCANLGIM